MKCSCKQTREDGGFVTRDGLLVMVGFGLLSAVLLPYWGREGWGARIAAGGGAVALLACLVTAVRFLLAFRSRRPGPDDDDAEPPR